MPKDIMKVRLEDALDSYDNAEEGAIEKLEEKGLGGPMSPPIMPDGTTFDGRIPANIGSLPPSEIGEYLELLTGHVNYVSWQRQIAELAKTVAKEKLQVTEAAVRNTKTGTQQQKRDSTLIDARYVEANSDWIEAKVYHDLLENLESAASRDLRTLSRLVETKKMELDSGKRSQRVNHRRDAPPRSMRATSRKRKKAKK